MCKMMLLALPLWNKAWPRLIQSDAAQEGLRNHREKACLSYGGLADCSSAIHMVMGSTPARHRVFSGSNSELSGSRMISRPPALKASAQGKAIPSQQVLRILHGIVIQRQNWPWYLTKNLGQKPPRHRRRIKEDWRGPNSF